jgi:acyl-CoA synthetase (AMP-forming)/AMP-acid ligase II
MADAPELLAAVLGAFRVGIVAVPVSTMVTAADLGGLLADSRARVLVCSSEFAEVASAALESAPDVTHLVVAGGAEPAVPDRVVRVSWEAAPEGTDPADAAADTSRLARTVAVHLRETGLLKAAMHRHANIRHVRDLRCRSSASGRDLRLSVPVVLRLRAGNSALSPSSGRQRS